LPSGVVHLELGRREAEWRQATATGGLGDFNRHSRIAHLAGNPEQVVDG
jgi:hypothetical protein